MKKLSTLAVVAFAFASTAMAKPAGTLVMRISKKTGQISMAAVDQRLKPGTPIASLNFAKVAVKSEKAATKYTANNELNASTSRSASLFFPGGYAGGYYRASYSRQVYSSYGGVYGGGGYISPYIGGYAYPNYGGYGYRPYAYAEDDSYAYAYCGSGAYGGIGSEAYGYGNYGYDNDLFNGGYGYGGY